MSPRLLVLALLLGCAAPKAGAMPPPLPSTQAESRGLDARLTNYAYPYPVQFFGTMAQGIHVEMAYMDVPPASGTPRGTVLLLHGKNFSGAYWARTIEALRNQGYRVIVPDQVGFGKSSKPTDLQYSFHQLAVLTRTLLGRIGIEKVRVVGHSMGGMLAARFALMFPDATEQLVLVNPIGLEDWKRVVPYHTIEAWVEREMRATPESIKQYMQQSYFAGQWKPEFDPLLEIQAGWAEGPDKALLARVSALTYDMIFTQPVLYEFPDIRAPTLLIIGQRDRTALGRDAVAPEVAKTLGDYPVLGRQAAEQIPGARLVPLDDMGHVPQFEAFEPYIKALSDFLAGAPTGS